MWYSVQFLHVVRYPWKLQLNHARQACPTFSKITNCQYLWERLSYFVYLLHLVTHPGKLQCYHVVLVGYGPACPKFSVIMNHQYLWKRLSDFVDFLQLGFCNCAGIVRHRLSASQIVKYFKLKRLIRGIKLTFWFR